MSKSRQTKIRSLSARFSHGHYIERHSHQWHQLLYATFGVLHLKTENSCWIVPAYRAIWIPSQLVHDVSMAGSVMMRTLYFHPSMKVLAADTCIGVNVSNLMRELIIHSCELGIITPESTENRHLVRFLLSRMKRMDLEPLTLPLPIDARGVSATESILENPAEDLATIARKSSTSLRTLQRIFAAETGMSLGRWRSQARLLSALPLLEQERTVTDVALDLGYESISAFVSSFRKFFGVTPAKYFRKRIS